MYLFLLFEEHPTTSIFEEHIQLSRDKRIKINALRMQDEKGVPMNMNYCIPNQNGKKFFMALAGQPLFGQG